MLQWSLTLVLNLTVYSRWVLVRHVGGSEGNRRFQLFPSEVQLIWSFKWLTLSSEIGRSSWEVQFFLEDFGNFGNFLIQSSEMGLLLSEKTEEIDKISLLELVRAQSVPKTYILYPGGDSGCDFSQWCSRLSRNILLRSPSEFSEWHQVSQCHIVVCLPFITWMAKLLPEIIIPLSLSWNTFRFWELQRKIERKVQNMKNIC